MITMNFCSQCGAKVNLKIPPGDNLPRFVCESCQAIHYQNPKIVVGCIPEWEDKILLCKRAIEPRYGLWTLPAGFMENNENTHQAAARETLEEATARVEITQLYALFSLPHISQIYLIYRGRLLDLDFSPGIESLEVALYPEADIPWDNLAFPVIKETLKHYFDDRSRGIYPLRSGEIIRQADNIITHIF